MGSTCAHHYPHAKFHLCSPYRTLDIWFFLLLANHNRYANEVLDMQIWWWQTTWVVLVAITTHIPSFINVALDTELWIFDFFVISQSEQICKWGIKYVHSVMTDHMGSTCAHHYPHTKFHQCSPYWTLDIWIFVISQSEQICKWGIKYVHLVMTDHMGSTCAHHYLHTKFHQCSPYRTLWTFDLFVISQSEQICKWGIKYAYSVTTDHMDITCAPPTTHIPSFINVAHTELWIFEFLLLANQNRHANAVSNMCIWWWQTTWVVLVPITTYIPSFINVVHTELCGHLTFLLLANQNRYVNEVLNMRIRWRQTTWILLVPTTHIPSLTKICHCVLIRERRFTIWCWRETNIHTYICTYIPAWQTEGGATG